MAMDVLIADQCGTVMGRNLLHQVADLLEQARPDPDLIAMVRQFQFDRGHGNDSLQSS